MIANVDMERLAAPAGPTGGKILRPSDGKPPKRVAFVQCAGSRDVNHLPYCSAVCCLASLKQAIYVREQLPDAEVTIYYIDRRTPGRNEDVLTRVAALSGRDAASRARSAAIEADGDGLLLKVEDVARRQAARRRAPTSWCWPPGMVPNLAAEPLPFALTRDEDGFGVDTLAARPRRGRRGAAARGRRRVGARRDRRGSARLCSVPGRRA